jgi:beta-phosphoglucomutase
MKHAVLFDVDGVLVDSYHAHYESWARLAAEFGRTVTEDEFARTFGRTSRDIIAALWPEESLDDDERIRSLDDRKEALYREIIAVDFPAMDGAVELIDALRTNGFALAVGSSGPPENVDLALRRLDRRNSFGAIVTGAEVTRGKPDPQVYLLAAERLGIEPRRCVVIEDAPAGIAAARAGGMASIGIASTGHTRAELRDADLVIDSLRELSATVISKVIR